MEELRLTRYVFRLYRDLCDFMLLKPSVKTLGYSCLGAIEPTLTLALSLWKGEAIN